MQTLVHKGLHHGSAQSPCLLCFSVPSGLCTFSCNPNSQHFFMILSDSCPGQTPSSSWSTQGVFSLQERGPVEVWRSLSLTPGWGQVMLPPQHSLRSVSLRLALLGLRSNLLLNCPLFGAREFSLLDQGHLVRFPTGRELCSSPVEEGTGDRKAQPGKVSTQSAGHPQAGHLQTRAHVSVSDPQTNPWERS